MKKIRLLSQLLIAMLTIAALGTSCESDTDDLNVERTYTVTFNSTGGTEIADVETIDGLIDQPTDPEMEGYTFIGWYGDAYRETLFDFSSTITKDIMIYAKWSINSYTLSFYTYEGDSSVKDRTMEYNSYITEPDPEPTREGYSLYGWCTEDGVLWNFNSDKMGASDMTLYANWDADGYKVYLYSAIDGDYSSSLPTLLYDSYSIYYDSEITYDATDPEDTEAYSFVGWYDNSDCEGDLYEFGVGTLATEDINLYAKWMIKSFKVTFDLDGGEFASEGLNIEVDADNSMMLDYGSIVTKPDPTPTNSDLGFIGWYTDATYTTAWDFETMMITEETTIYAKWLNIVGTAYFFNEIGAGDYTTSYSGMTTAEAESYEPIEINYTVTELFPTDVEYDFVGWFTASNFDEGSAYDFDTEVTDDLYLYAKWAIKTFDVTFNIGDGTFDGTDPSTEIDYGALVSKPANPSNGDLTFRGWYTEADGEGTEWDFETMTITAETTIYAYWMDIAGYVSYYNVDEAIEFTSYTSVEAYETADILMDQSAEELTPASSSTHYEFIGWYTADNFDSGEAYAFPEITEYNTDLKLYAKYKYRTYTVTFNTNGGTATEETTQTIRIFEKATAIAITYDGHLLQGWYNNGSLFDFDTEITSNIELTAQWTATGDYDYVIYNEADLQTFRTAVNSGSTTKSAVLANDITLTEDNWTPIGVGLGSDGYAGIFEGNNNTISGLKIDSDLGHRGLFGALSINAEIRNCTLSDIDIKTTGYYAYGNIGAFAGGVSGTSGSIYLTNLTVKSGTITGHGYVGGVIGGTTNANATGNGMIGVFTDCTVESDVTITGGGSETAAYNYNIGGISGSARNSTTFTNCHNKANITTNGCSYVGGITGNGILVKFTACSNSGDIYATGSHIGGIMAFNGANTENYFIGCYNTGNISGTGTNVGGIIGQLQNHAYFQACYNTGTIEGSSTLGGIVGGTGNVAAIPSPFVDCYYVSTTGLPAVGGGSQTLTNIGNVSMFTSISDLNMMVNSLNANTTLSLTDYYYVAGDATTPPSIVAK